MSFCLEGSGEKAYDWRCWVELLRGMVLNLESVNLGALEHP